MINLKSNKYGHHNNSTTLSEIKIIGGASTKGKVSHLYFNDKFQLIFNLCFYRRKYS